jgi:MoaA/NifB/PqqE/SkfB family radical SAM enzyme
MQLDKDATIKVIEIIRRESPNIYFTGGEPLLRQDIVQILQACKKLSFKSITINTNMSVMHRKMEILDYLTNLVASFDVLDEKEYAKILGVSIGMVKQVKDNIIESAKVQKDKGFRMTINCVITPETIVHVRDVMNFCFERDIRFATVPAELVGGTIDFRLKENHDYRLLIKDIIRAKNEGKPVYGSLDYLYTILDFAPFRCYPTLTPHIYPNGDLFYPCEPLQKVAANILKSGSYKRALKRGRKIHGPLPMCRDKCFKACYIEASNFVIKPRLLLTEFV